jgi:uncharacterized protein
MPDPVRVALVLAVVAGAATVKGTIGFGFPLVAVPLIATIVGPRVAVPLIAIPTLLSNVILVSRGGVGRAAASLMLVMAGIIVGTFAGALLIKTLHPRFLSALLGAAALLYVLSTAFRLTSRIVPSAGRRAAPVIGLAAGVLGGATGIFSPLLASYLHLLQLTKREFVFWITMMFFVGNSVQVVSYLRLGLYGGPVLGLALLACLPMALGTWAGILLQDRLAPETFSRVVLAIVFVASLNLLVQGFVG